MKNCALCVFLLLTLPSFGTIQQRTGQSPVSQFNNSASSTCSNAFGATPTAGDLFVVWTYWSTGLSQNQLTAKVTDSSLPAFNNNFVSAVGPTLQVASNTYSQIFYAANIRTVTGQLDTLTVTYSLNGGATNANTSGCVFVEYQGADPNYPLDSVSAGYSYSVGSFLDSGTAAPANANLLVFGAGTSDHTSTTPLPGTGFTAIQSNGGSITEQNTNPITGNNVLQRATAGYLSPPPTGNWVMQMAVFRDASWTVGGGWTPVRPGQILDATQFPGSDFGAKVTAAVAAAPSAGGIIDLSGFAGTSNWTTVVTLNKPVHLLFGEGTYTCPSVSAAPIVISPGTNGVTIEGRGYKSMIACDPGNFPIISAINSGGLNYSGIHVTNLQINNLHIPQSADSTTPQWFLVYFNGGAGAPSFTDSSIDHIWSTAGRGIYVRSVARVSIDHNFLQNQYDFGVAVGGDAAMVNAHDSTDVSISYNGIWNCQDSTYGGPPHDISVEDTDHSTIDHNDIIDSGAFALSHVSSAIQVYANQDSSVVSDSVSDNSMYQNAIGMYPVSGIIVFTPNPSKNNTYDRIVVANNKIFGYSLGIYGTDLTTATVVNSSITGNTINGVLANTLFGIEVAAASAALVTGNSFTVANNVISNQGTSGINLICIAGVNVTGNTVTLSGNDGIWLQGSQHTNVTGNQSFNNGKSGPGPGYGINLSADGTVNALNNNLVANQLYDDQGASATQAYGLHIASSTTGTFVDGNRFDSNKTGWISDFGTTLYGCNYLNGVSSCGISGQCVLGHSCLAISFGITFNNAPVCTCSDVSNADACKPVATTSSLTITGNDTDTISYFCTATN